MSRCQHVAGGCARITAAPCPSPVPLLSHTASYGGSWGIALTVIAGILGCQDSAGWGSDSSSTDWGWMTALARAVSPIMPDSNLTSLLIALILVGSCLTAHHHLSPVPHGPAWNPVCTVAAAQAESERFHSAIVTMHIKGVDGPVEMTLTQNALADTGAGWDYLPGYLSRKLKLRTVPIASVSCFMAGGTYMQGPDTAADTEIRFPEATKKRMSRRREPASRAMSPGWCCRYLYWLVN